MDQALWDQINRIGDAQICLVVANLVEQLDAGNKTAQFALSTSKVHRDRSGHAVLRAADLQKRIKRILPELTIKAITSGTIPTRGEFVVVISVE